MELSQAVAPSFQSFTAEQFLSNFDQIANRAQGRVDPALIRLLCEV